jgi:hypothetical protein
MVKCEYKFGFTSGTAFEIFYPHSEIGINSYYIFKVKKLKNKINLHKKNFNTLIKKYNMDLLILLCQISTLIDITRCKSFHKRDGCDLHESLIINAKVCVLF